MPAPSARALLASVLLAAAPAQSVLTVGGSSAFAQIDDAIAVAQDGDVIRVLGGNYLPFTCDKAVTIVAASAFAVQIVPPLVIPGPGPGPTRFQVPAGRAAYVRGIHWKSPSYLQVGGNVFVDSGTVSLEDCSIEGALTSQQVLRVQNAAVSLRNCTLTVGFASGPATALRAMAAHVVAVDCVFEGSAVSPSTIHYAGHGILATTSRLHLVRCQVRGGDSHAFACNLGPGDAVHTDRGQWTWISDSTLIGGDGSCGTGGAGLRVQGSWSASLARNTLLGGAGATQGAAVSGPSVAAELVGLDGPLPAPRLGVSYDVAFRTAPGRGLVVMASIDLDGAFPTATAETTWAPANGALLFAAIQADAAGSAPLSVAVPNAPQLLDVGVWLHAVDFAQAPWRLSPPVGGLLH